MVFKGKHIKLNVIKKKGSVALVYPTSADELQGCHILIKSTAK